MNGGLIAKITGSHGTGERSLPDDYAGLMVEAGMYLLRKERLRLVKTGNWCLLCAVMWIAFSVLSFWMRRL